MLACWTSEDRGSEDDDVRRNEFMHVGQFTYVGHGAPATPRWLWLCSCR